MVGGTTTQGTINHKKPLTHVKTHAHTHTHTCFTNLRTSGIHTHTYLNSVTPESTKFQHQHAQQHHQLVQTEAKTQRVPVRVGTKFLVHKHTHTEREAHTGTQTDTQHTYTHAHVRKYSATHTHTTTEPQFFNISTHPNIHTIRHTDNKYTKTHTFTKEHTASYCAFLSTTAFSGKAATRSCTHNLKPRRRFMPVLCVEVVSVGVEW